MEKRKSSILAVFLALLSLIGVSILLGQGCGSRIDNGGQQQQGATNEAQIMAQNLPGAPAKALFGQYFKDKNKRVWIYDGAHWVPRDSSVDTYYQQFITPNNGPVIMSMTQGEVFSSCSATDATGAHFKHSGFDCKVCHMVGGVMCFDPAGPATSPTATIPPSFDATAKTCSNIKCHGVSAGTFSYYFPGNETDADGYPIPELVTVNVYGNPGGNTPSWYTTGIGCTGCHNNPPANGTSGSNAWHSGFHANNQNVGAINPNACELCHNDPTKPYGTWVPIAFSQVGADGKYHGYQINPAAAAQHANGTYTVLGKFVSQCFGCH
jgi:hypothetical protein